MDVGKPKVGTGSQPTLKGKPVAELNDDPPEDLPTDPKARSYAARVQNRRKKKRSAETLKGKAPPLGHVDPPPSEKMEAIANKVGEGMARPTFFGAPTESEKQANQEAEMGGPPQPPPIPGVGSAYPINQEVTRGTTDGPVSLREAKRRGGLSQESIQALKMVQDDSGKTQTPPQEQEEVELRKPITSVAQETKDELEDATDDFLPEDAIDMGELAEARKSIVNPERKKLIESRLGELDIGDMIMKRELVQEVPIIPDKFTVTLRTVSQRENIWILKYLYDFPGSQAYLQELLNTCRLVCGLTEVNGQHLPDHRVEVGTHKETVDKEAFERKLFNITSYPVQLVADMSVQQLWFQDRVNKLLTMDNLKNG